MGFRNDGPSDAWLLAAPESNEPSGDMNVTLEIDGDEYEVELSFDDGRVYAASIVGIVLPLYSIETKRFEHRVTVPYRVGEAVIMDREWCAGFEVDFAEQCAEAA